MEPSALAADPNLPVRPVYRSEYPAQYIESIWLKDNDFRVVLGYSNACTIAGSDSFLWRSGQLNGQRIGFDRIALEDDVDAVVVAVKSLKRTRLKLFHPSNNRPAEVLDSVSDTSYWAWQVKYEIEDSFTSVECAAGEKENDGLLVTSTMREMNSVSLSSDRTWQLTGRLNWRNLNTGEGGEPFETGGITAVKSLRVPDEDFPRVYCGVTYESGSYTPGAGGQVSMGCEIIRYDIEYSSETAFQTLAGYRADDGIAPNRVNVVDIEAGLHPDLGSVVVVLYGRDEAESLVLLYGDDLEPIATTELPPENEVGLPAGLVWVGGGNYGAADVLVVYKSGSVLAATITGGELEVSRYSLGSPVISAAAGNFDDDPQMELAATIDRRLNVFEVLPLESVAADAPRPSLIGLTVFPNPFNSTTTINYTLPASGRYAVDVVDINGRFVQRLSGGWKEAGSYRDVLNGGQLTNGQYLIRLNKSGQIISQQIVLIK